MLKSYYLLCLKISDKPCAPENLHHCRSKTEEPEYLSTSPFVLPQEVYNSQSPAAPSGIVGPPTAPAAAALVDPLDDLFGPANPVAGSEFLAGTGLETLEAPALDYGSKFGVPLFAFFCTSCQRKERLPAHTV